MDLMEDLPETGQVSDPVPPVEDKRSAEPSDEAFRRWKVPAGK
jgi:hypothetical protein